MDPSKRRYTLLLPANTSSSTSSSGPNAGSTNYLASMQQHQQQQQSRRPKKGSQARSACDHCRARKTACDGMRPVCKRCRRRGETECNYSTRSLASLDPVVSDQIERLGNENSALKERLMQADHLLNALQNSLQGDSHALLKRLLLEHGLPGAQVGEAQPDRLERSDGLDKAAEMVLPSKPPTTASHELPPWSGLDPTIRLPLPPTQSSFEFELMVRHPVAYPALDAVEPANMANETGFEVGGALEEKAQQQQESMHGPSPSYDAGDEARKTSSLPVPAEGHHTRVYCDKRLAQLDIGQWTNIAVSDAFAADAISLYLETDHPLLGLFDADLFLTDLVSGDVNFCSTLLVNALLCWPSQAYSYFEWDSALRSEDFYDESKRLWEKSGVQSLTTMAAAMLLSTAAACYGLGHEAQSFMVAGTQMGQNLSLFDITEPALDWLGHSPEWVRAAAHTAWGVYSFITSRCLHHHIGQIAYPPSLPKPGAIFAGEHGDPNVTTLLRGTPLPHRTPPPYMGRTFTHMCDFWSVVHEILWSYYGGHDETTAQSRAVLEQAMNYYHQLLDWADKLPLELARGDNITHHATVAHIYYHAIITDLFRPFIVGPNRDRQLAGFESAAATPITVYHASVHQLQRLVLLYRTPFPNASYTFLWHTGLLYVANAMLSLTVATAPTAHETYDNSDVRRAWFQLCLGHYRDMAAAFPIVQGIVQGLLSMAMRSQLMHANEARAFMHGLGAGGLGLGKGRTGQGGFILDFDLAVSDPLVSHVEDLADQFNTLALWEEFTNEGDYS